MPDDLHDLIDKIAAADKVPASEAIRKCLYIGAAVVSEPSLEKQVGPILEVVSRVAAASGTVRKQLVEIRAILVGISAASRIPAAQSVLIKCLLREVEKVVSRAERDRIELKEACRGLRCYGPITREEAKLLRDQVKLAADDAVDTDRKKRFERLVQVLTLLGGV